RVMGQPVRRWIVAPTTEVASSPPGAAIAAQWLEPIAHNDAATLLRGQRELSTAEREELRRFARRLWRRPLPFAIGFTLYFFVPLATLLQEGLRESRADGFLFLLMAWVTLRIDTAFARALWHARRLEQDAREGRIVILRTDPITPPVTDEAPPPESASPPPDALIEAGSPLPEGDGSSRSEEAAAAGSKAPAAEDAVPLEPPAEAPVVELLPRSRWYWTIDGRPAPWRVVRP
ncbi:MAG TPA: hypothetical protein VFO24_09605, partial [Usitatibacter sp.]|nr:hypothetical protein [Usitatibacter sp.]